MEQVIKKERKTKDKIVLTHENNEKLHAWKSLFEKWNDIVTVTKSDLVNFILSQTPETLSVNEVKTLLKDVVNRNEKPKERKPRQKRAGAKTSSNSNNII